MYYYFVWGGELSQTFQLANVKNVDVIIISYDVKTGYLQQFYFFKIVI